MRNPSYNICFNRRRPQSNVKKKEFLGKCLKKHEEYLAQEYFFSHFLFSCKVFLDDRRLFFFTNLKKKVFLHSALNSASEAGPISCLTLETQIYVSQMRDIMFILFGEQRVQTYCYLSVYFTSASSFIHNILYLFFYVVVDALWY